jgi:glyoxylate reductase
MAVNSMLKQPRVVVTRKLPDQIEARMKELFNAELRDPDSPMSRSELFSAVGIADVLVPTVTDRIDEEVFGRAGAQLKLVANFGAGVDNIDLESAQHSDIVVTNTPGVLTEDTADMTMAMILAVPRRVVEGERLVSSNQWEGWGPTTMLGHRIWGKRLGIIGMGQIGTAVARRAQGFGLSIHYHNRNRLPLSAERELEATYWESLDQMLAHMDIISVNCPRTPSTYHLLSMKRLALMKSDAYLVNTSRGEVVDEAALAARLRAGRLAGAALDVFEHEPAINQELRELPNVLLLPHMGSATLEGRIDMGEKVLVNIRTFVDGHKPPDRVIATLI